MSITNKEIWNMLKSKMVKNGIVSDFALKTNNGCSIYDEDMLIKAVALAYRCGYERAKKNRPFKYGDKVEENNGKVLCSSEYPERFDYWAED